MTDHHHRLAGDAPQATDDRTVVGKCAIAMQFFEVVDDTRDIVERVGSQRMACELRNLPRRQVGKDLLGQRAALALEALDLFLDVDFIVITDQAQLFDFCLEFGDRLLKFKKIKIHRYCVG